MTAVLHSRTPILAGLGFLTLIIALALPVLAQAPVDDAIARYHTEGLEATLGHYNDPDDVDAQ